VVCGILSVVCSLRAVVSDSGLWSVYCGLLLSSALFYLQRSSRGKTSIFEKQNVL